MAINLNSGDSSSSSSPRISFSHDLTDTNSNLTHEPSPKRLDMSLLSSSEFNFCVSDSFPESETSPADDLFFNGVIIPIQMKQKLNSMKQEEITSTTTATILREQKTAVKSFWGFKRSSSLNCENYGYKKSSSLSSWSMPLLFRSKSTGSSSNDHSKQSQKNTGSSNGKFTNHSSNQSVKFSTPSCQKPPLLKKSGSGGGGSYVNGVRIGGSAALNVPPPYITKGTSDLLGFGSLFRNGSREKKAKN